MSLSIAVVSRNLCTKYEVAMPSDSLRVAPSVINRWVFFVRICNYVKTVITFEGDKSIILIEAFQDRYISSFNERNLHLLFIAHHFRSWSKLSVAIA